MKVVIIDCCLGNLRSVQKALEAVGADVTISNRREDVVEAESLVLPGVGAFKEAVKNIRSLKPIIAKQVEHGKPLLGICLGLQLLFTRSREGGLHMGLNILKGQVIRFPQDLKVPQIGWNTLQIVDPTNPLVDGLSDKEYVYFVHSYYAQPEEERNVVAVTQYGVCFPSIIAKDNVFATQFHPEKSGGTGLAILRNFLNYTKK